MLIGKTVAGVIQQTKTNLKKDFQNNRFKQNFNIRKIKSECFQKSALQNISSSGLISMFSEVNTI